MINKAQMDELTKEAYLLFSPYTIGRKLQLCTACCVTLEDEAELVRTPLKEISRDLMDTAYFESARNYSDQELKEMKHFLPRVLEMMVNFEFPVHSLEITLARLDIHLEEKWAQKELIFLNNFMKKYFEYYLSIPMPKISIDEILVMIGNHFDINNLFEVWTSTNTPESISHFCDLVLYNSSFSGNQLLKINNSFCESQLNEQLISWYNKETTKAHFSKQIEHQIMENHLSEEQELNYSCVYEMLIV